MNSLHSNAQATGVQKFIKNVSGKIKVEVTIKDMDHPWIYYGLITTQKEKQPKLNVPLILETRKKHKNSLKISQIYHFTSSICIK